MKRIFIILLLFSINSHSQKKSISKTDSIAKIELKNKITSLQLKLDSIVMKEELERKKLTKQWSVNGRVTFIFNQTSHSNWLAGGENNIAGNILINYDFNYINDNSCKESGF